MQPVLYSEKQLDEMIPLSRSTRWRMRQAGEFPNPFPISKGRVAYEASAIDAWVNSKMKKQGEFECNTQNEEDRMV